MWKTLLKMSILLAAAAYLIFALILFSNSNEDIVCTDLDIVVSDEDITGFINENEIRELLVANNMFPEGKAIKDISLAELEATLKSSPYIDNVRCYQAADGHIAIHVIPRIPVLHVINLQGEDFYIDNKGGVMPRAHHKMNLPIMTGHVNKKTAGGLYAPFGNSLAKDTFWNNQIQEIHVTNTGELELTPRVGNHTILLGDTSLLADKMERMRIFYTEGLDKAGWNKYKTINLKFSNQVICTRR